MDSTNKTGFNPGVHLKVKVFTGDVKVPNFKCLLVANSRYNKRRLIGCGNTFFIGDQLRWLDEWFDHSYTIG